MTALTTVSAGLLGLAVGSFANVVVYRVPHRMSLLRPPSSCPSCRVEIGPRDNVPLLSYVLLRGRCRSCGVPISPRYPIVEAATAALWVFSVLRFDLESAVFVALSATVFLVLSLIDLEHRRLPNVIVLPATAAAFAWVVGVGVFRPDGRLIVRAVACGAAYFALLFVIALVSGGMGFGDVKLGAFVGLVTGRFSVGIALAGALGGFIVGGLAAVALLATRRKGRKDVVPFGPSMALGATFAVFAGEGIVRRWFGL